MWSGLMSWECDLWLCVIWLVWPNTSRIKLNNIDIFPLPLIPKFSLSKPECFFLSEILLINLIIWWWEPDCHWFSPRNKVRYLETCDSDLLGFSLTGRSPFRALYDADKRGMISDVCCTYVCDVPHIALLPSTPEIIGLPTPNMTYISLPWPLSSFLLNGSGSLTNKHVISSHLDSPHDHCLK